MKDIGVFQLAKIVVNRFVINSPGFAFQIFGNRTAEKVRPTLSKANFTIRSS